MGYHGKLVAHGLRSIASTYLNEKGYNPELIEVALSHINQDRIRMAYKRIGRAENGNFGDHKLLPNTGGIYEMRIDTGKGYRIYYAQAGEIIYLLTNGGDKTTQQADIEKAKAIWADYQQTGGNNE